MLLTQKPRERKRDISMIVTEIAEISASRVKVYVDEEFAFVLYKGELRKYGLKQGNPMEQRVYDELMHTVLPKRAALRCMNLLKSRDYTVWQLRNKLLRGYYPPGAVEEAIAYVSSFGYVDDLRYAADYINCCHKNKSRRRIDNDLQRKGIASETIMRAWEQWQTAGNEQDEEEQINRLLEKKHFDKERADRRELQRIYAFLARRGFDSDKICKVLLK